MSFPRDIEAEIYFLPTEEGGRTTPIFSGYRGQFYYDCQDWDAPHEYPEVDKVEPGDTVRAYLGFLSPTAHHGKIEVGMEFEVREGSRTVGRGKVTQILELPNSAAKVSSHAT